MTEPTIRLVSAEANFYPEDQPEGTIEWTFLATKATPVRAGIYELRFVRPLNTEERAGRDYSGAFAGE